MSDRHYERAAVLMNQQRYDLAAKELRLALAANSENASIHATLSICLTKQGFFRDAEWTAREALRLGPDFATAHYALGCALRLRSMLGPAANALREAIRLEPECAEYLGELACIRVNQQRWAEALSLAELGLRTDSANSTCASMRAIALSYLGRSSEAEETLISSLAGDPTSTWTHTHYGLTLLRAGRYDEALEVLREAMRLEPDNDYSRRSYLLALKSRRPILRLAFFSWDWQIRRSNVMWLVTISLVWVPLFTWPLRELSTVSATICGLLILAYSLIVIGYWVIDAATDILLRFDREGRNVLTRFETVAGTSVALLFATAFVTAAVGVAAMTYKLVTSGVLLLMVCLPLSWMRSLRSRRARWTLAIIVSSLAVAALAPVMCSVDARGLPSDFEGGALLFVSLGAFVTHIAALVFVVTGDRSASERRLR